MFKPITRFGTTARWSDATVHRGVAYVVEVPQTLPADARSQALEVLSQLEATLLKVGSAKDQLLMCTIYLADMADREVFNEVWDAWLVRGTAPVRACVQAGLTDPGYKLEIQAVAAV
jgi:enamine deaminase RidA (YjgF/YER057c/UK114 family)